MQKTVAISTFLQEAAETLLKISDTPRLDVELILADVLSISRAQLFALTQLTLSALQTEKFFHQLHLLQSGMPMAYVRGKQDFWSLSFCVTPDVLIPRADTELLVETILHLFPTQKISLADLGTGSGAIAISLAHEKPDWEICATDQSKKALEIARKNAIHYHLNHIIFYEGNWCEALPREKKYDVIVSNPPYIAKDDQHLKALRLQHEPQSALVSEENGLKDLAQIIEQAKYYLISQGVLLLEHGFDQALPVRELFKKNGYKKISTLYDLSQQPRVTLGMR